ncbi:MULTISPECIES: cation:dicarboxylate symporter family transporter [Clostridium]|uniref:cation:dicarboxylate symporter family transporter n=1 Tax=Clostridium TaxID=1485 RepID=UPI00069EB19B|nr:MULTISPECIES: cation:dicarboxylase symporter family transporter [Clostridium]KOF58014.1 glutamate:protein symporter [Clostridium sp. DMHC 10]MCD2348665.1 cation:dicarboxylase symporter family transporter [Clostridium guangxiense]
MKKIKFGLAFQIVLGLVLGIIVGAVFYGNATAQSYLKPLGDIFLRLIKMIVVPIVFSAIVVGVSSLGDIKKVGKIGAKTLLYFEIVSTFAIVLGLIIANVVKPGTGIDMHQLAKTSIDTYVNTAKTSSHKGTLDIIVNIVPSNIFEALTNGELLPVIFFSVMFGLGTAAIGEKGKVIIEVFSGIENVMFWVTNQIMKVAPIGVFGLIGLTISKFGVKSLVPLGKLVLTTYGAMFIFVFLVFGFIAKFIAKTSVIKIIRILKDEIILAYTTASSEAVLPKVMEKMEKFGAPQGIISFVVPTGYSFNLDGSALYQSIAAIFIAQLYGVHLSLITQINLVIVLMVTSKGMAAVPGTSFVVLLATLGSVGIPVEGVAFIAGIDRILDMARTVVNVIGNSLAVIVISRWEGQYNSEKGQEYVESIQSIA